MISGRTPCRSSMKRRRIFIKRFDIPPCPAVIGELQAELGKEDASATAVARFDWA